MITSDFQAAKLELAKWVTSHGEMRNEKSEDVPLETILVRYWQRHASKLASARSQRVAMEYLSEFFAGALISDLTVRRQEEFIEWLSRKDLSSSYIKKILGAGKWALNYAWKRQEISSSPHILTVPENRPSMTRLELDEIVELFDAIEQHHLFMFVMLALNTLSRPGALLELKVDQCDLSRDLTHLNPDGRNQTKKRRPIVPISQTLRPFIEAIPEGYLIQFRGKPVRSIKTAWRKMVRRAGLRQDITPMTLRRTMARELRRRGVQPWDLAGLMGHVAQESTTEIYAEYDPEYLKQAIQAIDAYLAEVNERTRHTKLRASCVLGPPTPTGYPIEKLERVSRIELPTRSLGSYCSTTELHPHK